MKISFLSAVVMPVFLLASCSKDETAINEVRHPLKVKYHLDNIQLDNYKLGEVKTNSSISHLLDNPNDSDDEKINYHLYELSLATREMIKDPGFNQTIIRMARSSEVGAANLLDLVFEEPIYYQKIDSVLFSNSGLTLKDMADDLTYTPIAPHPDYPETSEIEHYVPAIFIPNLENIDDLLQPIISPGIEVDCALDEKIEDNIVAWYYADSSSSLVTEIMISEQTASQTANPLFVLDNAVTTLTTEQNITATPLITEGSQANSGNQDGTLAFHSYEHKINYRYESGFRNRSEFTLQAIRIDPSGNVHWIHNQGLGGEPRIQINRIKTQYIGVTLLKWVEHSPNFEPWSNPWTPSFPQNGVNMVYWNTYERDWHRSSKGLGTVTHAGSTINLAGRRKYTSEWYAWVPSTAQVHYTRFQWIYDHWAHWNNSWKSDYLIWRVYI